MSEETEILNALFAAAMGLDGAQCAPGEALWLRFLERLAAMSQAESAHLAVFWSTAPPSIWQYGPAGGGLDAATIERMRADRVYSQVDLPGPDAPRRSLRALKWRLGQDGVALLLLQRERSDFRALSAVQLTNLIPHLRLALQGWRQLEQRRGEAALDRQLARDLGAGWVVFSPSGQIKRMAPDMAPGPRTGVGAAAGDVRDSHDAQALRQALAAALRARDAQIVDLSLGCGVQMIVAPESLAGERVLLARLRHARSARALPLAVLMRRFGLSRSEARLAACLCDGLSQQEAAQALGWTRETTRSYAKQIYAKLGVNGHSATLRRLLLDALWLEPAAQ